ncbi:hypothetical protein ACOSP7_022332 [Xanthoceras sorbifolium]
MCTLKSLIADVYLFTLSKLPELNEKFKVEIFVMTIFHATPDAAFVYISIDSSDDSSEEDQTSNMRSTTPAGDANSEYSAQLDYNLDSCDYSAHWEDQVASDSEDVHLANSDGNGCNEENRMVKLLILFLRLKM